MRYVSTRGEAPVLDFEGALLAGLATDGGLYLPESWPSLSADEWRELRGAPYHEVAATMMAPFAGDAFDAKTLAAICRDAYGGFDHAAVAPVSQIGPDAYLLELFYGPTLAFKDYAMQVLGRLFDAALARRGARATIVGATSGDTGPAAMAACGGRENIDVFILFPDGRTSPVQRRQMTTLTDPNVHAVGVLGAFDDCQDLVKAMFADARFREDIGLTAVNSINWARVLAQTAYYAAAALAVGAPDRPVAFSVPTGNFGNVFAAWVARRMGLPIERLIVACNANDILARFFADNDMTLRGVTPTYSPSMDIQVSSNFERLLFELSGRDGAAVAKLMADFRADGKLATPAAWWTAARRLFAAHAMDDEQTIAAIARLKAQTGRTFDPHSAIGVEALRAEAADLGRGVARIAVATAHPAKFPAAIEAAIGAPAKHARLEALAGKPERAIRLRADLGETMRHIRSHARILKAAA